MEQNLWYQPVDTILWGNIMAKGIMVLLFAWIIFCAYYMVRTLHRALKTLDDDYKPEQKASEGARVTENKEGE